MERYQRQTCLEGFGAEAQSAFRDASVLIVGAGGLGVPVAQYLVGAGVSKITVVDGDKVELSNLHRQVAYTEDDISKPKVEALTERLEKLNSECELVGLFETVSCQNIKTLLQGIDLVFECSDSFSCKFLVNDACYESGTPVLLASILRFEAQLGLFGTESFGSYRHLFPSAPKDVPTCQEAGVLGPACGLVGSMQALEGLKLLAKQESALSGNFLTVCLQTYNLQKLKFNPKPDLLEIKTLQTASHYQSESQSDMKSINPKELAALENVKLLDVREDAEREICSIGGEHIPLGDLPARAKELDANQTWVIYCKMGGRSAQACQFLAEHAGFKDVTNLDGGILKYQEEVDPSLKRY